MATALAASVSQAGAASGSDQYMKFSKFGEWVYGIDNTEVEEGSVWAVNPMGFQHGFIAWGSKARGNSGQPAGELMAPATQPMPQEGNLPSVNGDWSKAVGIQLRCTNGEDKDIQVVFKSNSVGGRKAYAAIVQAVLERITAGNAECMPLVNLKADSYDHKEYGKIFTPVLEVAGWADHTALDAAPAEKLPWSGGLVASEPAPEPEPQPEEPRRRRRRAA
jgi:hypothetical protein